jgi:hypothetical protein
MGGKLSRSDELVARSAPELTKPSETGKFLQVAPEPARKGTDGVRLILENSTVCHSRRISL